MRPVYKWATLVVYRQRVWLDYLQRCKGGARLMLPVLEPYRSPERVR